MRAVNLLPGGEEQGRGKLVERRGGEREPPGYRHGYDSEPVVT